MRWKPTNLSLSWHERISWCEAVRCSRVMHRPRIGGSVSRCPGSGRDLWLLLLLEQHRMLMWCEIKQFQIRTRVSLLAFLAHSPSVSMLFCVEHRITIITYLVYEQVFCLILQYVGGLGTQKYVGFYLTTCFRLSILIILYLQDAFEAATKFRFLSCQQSTHIGSRTRSRLVSSQGIFPVVDGRFQRLYTWIRHKIKM